MVTLYYPSNFTRSTTDQSMTGMPVEAATASDLEDAKFLEDTTSPSTRKNGQKLTWSFPTAEGNGDDVEDNGLKISVQKGSSDGWT